MRVWGITDTGLVRKENQDAYAAELCEETGQTICVVCDGMLKCCCKYRKQQKKEKFRRFF